MEILNGIAVKRQRGKRLRVRAFRPFFTDKFFPRAQKKGRALSTALFFGFSNSIRLSHGFRIELREG